MSTDPKQDDDIPEEMYNTPPPAGEMFLPDGRPRCRLFRYGEQCLGPANEEHEHYNPKAKPWDAP